jgi:hypothetical protein
MYNHKYEPPTQARTPERGRALAEFMSESWNLCERDRQTIRQSDFDLLEGELAGTGWAVARDADGRWHATRKDGQP